MKNIRSLLLPLLLLFCFTTTAYAQEHLKFMGIPLTGSIDNFQQKLAAKGIRLDKSANSQVGFGARMFKGKFTDRDCLIGVSYSKKKIVYKATAIYTTYDSDEAENYQLMVQGILKKKYPNAENTSGNDNGTPCEIFYIPASDGKTLLGTITVKRAVVDDDYGSYLYAVGIEYLDEANGSEYFQNAYDDL